MYLLDCPHCGETNEIDDENNDDLLDHYCEFCGRKIQQGCDLEPIFTTKIFKNNSY